MTPAGKRSRDFYILGVRSGRLLARAGKLDLAFVAELHPLAISTNMPVGYDTVSCGGFNSTCFTLQPRTSTVFGVGVSPLGLRAARKVTERIRLSLEVAGGALYFSKPMPDPATRRFNYVGSILFNHREARLA
jgi:hypothetical protein